MAYDATTILTAIRAVLNEASAAFFSDAEINEWVSQAALDISGICRCVEDTDLIAMKNGVASYNLPAASIQAVHAREEATGIGLIRITPSIAGHESGGGDGETPLRWFEWNRKFYIEPRPDSAMDGKNIEVFFFKETNAIADIPFWCQHLAIDYAVYRGKLKDRLYAEAATLYAAYLNSLLVRRNDVYAHLPHTMADLKIADVSVEQ